MKIGDENLQSFASQSVPAVSNGRSGGLRTPSSHRAIFVSDIHLGSGSAKSLKFLNFLETHAADTIYLVGDIVDNWHPLWRGWSADHHLILRRLLELPLAGKRVVYIPGNHDAFFRRYTGDTFNGIEVAADAVHVAADGRKFLVVHGDCCDVFAVRAFILAFIGNLIETGARKVDAVQRRALRTLLSNEWEGIDHAISAVNKFFRKMDRFEERLTDLARHRG
ncbi:MAG: UDP-2,3-diacylglucosamine diphosphatase, partial [Paracoccaceae bacterium]|nr:UDP-2,3-diacylglucosamine diphosphatase [Paracoccaceae bacterium]